MSCSQFAGTAIMPFLGRIVLCVAFVSAGANKLLKDATFTSEQATILNTHGIEVKPLAPPETPDTADTPADVTSIDPSAASPPAFQFASLQVAAEDDEPAGDAAIGAAPKDVSDLDTGAEPETGIADADSGPAAEPVEPVAPGTQKGLYKITLMLDAAGLPYPKVGAWIAALTELIGGGLLLVGFFSRIWGLGLAITMGMAFYLTTMQGDPAAGVPPVFSVVPWTYAENTGAFNTMFSQLGLGVLALGILLTGPGPISLDRLFFGKRGGGSGQDDGDSG